MYGDTIADYAEGEIIQITDLAIASGDVTLSINNGETTVTINHVSGSTSFTVTGEFAYIEIVPDGSGTSLTLATNGTRRWRRR